MGSNFHGLMFPWFAFGHMTPFLHLANKLAEKGHKITYLLPMKAQQQLQHQNSFPDKIIFHTVTVPSVDGLPDGTETASDIPISLGSFLATAMDSMRDQVEDAVRVVKPDVIFFDFCHWIPEIGKEYGIKTVNFVIIGAVTVALSLLPGRNQEDLSLPPPGYPSSKLLLRGHETNSLSFLSFPFGDKITFYERITTGLIKCDIILLRTCQELDGKYCDFIEKQYKKKVLLAGPVLPDVDKTTPLEDQWKNWLSRFEPGSVVYCAFGSQIILEKEQFQELCLGIEQTGLPFLVALKTPRGASTIEEALPEGFEERVMGRGVVYGGWVQQPLILSHKSVGCFVSHCGFGSMWESIVSDCQIVLVPHLGDHIINTRLLTEELEISVEVKRDEKGWFSKESLRDAIKTVMDKDSQVGNQIRKNHVKWKECLGSDGLISSYVDKFVDALQKQI